MSESLGYVFVPSDEAAAIGHAALRFNLYGTPTEAHFDPEYAVLSTVDRDGTVTRLTLSHPYAAPASLRVCPGVLTLRDRKSRSVDAFTFGGQLSTTAHEDRTACELVSPAPVFEVADAPGLDVEDVHRLLVEEFEALLAQRSAHWASDPAEFARRLASIEPALCYSVALATIAERIRSIPPDRRPETYRMTAVAIRGEIRRLQARGRWTSPPPALDEVL